MSVRADRIWARDVTGGGAFRWFNSEEFQGEITIPPGRVYESGDPPPPCTPPSIELYNVPAQNIWYRSNQQIPWRVTVGTDPVTVREYVNAQVVETTNARSGVIDHSSFGPGWKDIWAEVANACGGWVSTAHWVGGFDNLAPTVGFTGFTPGSPSNSPTVQISVQGIDSLSGVNRIDVLVDSALIGTVTGSSGAVVWNAGGYAEGPHTIQAVAYDNAVPGGNPSQTETVTFTLDRTGPPTSATLSPTSPNGYNGWYVTAPTLTLTSSDPSGIAYRRYRINGGPWQDYTAPVVVNEQGSVLVQYFSRDNAGNDGPIGATTIRIDTTPPPAPTLTDEGIKTPSQTLLQLAITGGIDPESGIGRITYMVGNGPGDDRWRAATTVPAFGPFLVIEGLFIPPWESVVVTARVTNGAGVQGPWGNSDGILIEPTAFDYFANNRLFGSAGGVGLHPDLVLEGSLGETTVGESRFLPDVELLAGFWGEHDLLSMPTAFQLTFGEAVPGGHLFDTYFLDTRRLEAMERFDQETVVPVQWVFESDAPILEPSLLELYLWSRADEAGRGRRVELYDFNLQEWVPVHSSLMQSSDELSRITVAVDPWRFVSFEQKVRARFSFEPIVSETSNRLRIGLNRVFWRFIRR